MLLDTLATSLANPEFAWTVTGRSIHGTDVTFQLESAPLDLALVITADTAANPKAMVVYYNGMTYALADNALYTMIAGMAATAATTTEAALIAALTTLPVPDDEDDEEPEEPAEPEPPQEPEEEYCGGY
jgi:hypothetical protein